MCTRVVRTCLIIPEGGLRSEDRLDEEGGRVRRLRGRRFVLRPASVPLDHYSDVTLQHDLRRRYVPFGPSVPRITHSSPSRIQDVPTRLPEPADRGRGRGTTVQRGPETGLDRRQVQHSQVSAQVNITSEFDRPLRMNSNKNPFQVACGRMGAVFGELRGWIQAQASPVY